MYNYNSFNDNRLIPFAGPFLLGSLVGGAAVGAFNPYRPRPYYQPRPMYPAYGPMYPPYPVYYR